MKIELKKIALLKSLSEETPAYTADLYVDGKLLAHVSNHGHGGSDMIHPPKGVDHWKVNDEYERINKIVAATYPKHTYKAGGEEHSYDESLECICHTQVWDSDLVKTIKRDLTGKVMFLKTDGKLYSIKAKASEQQQLIAHVKAQPATKTVLNTLTIEEAVAIYKAQ